MKNITDWREVQEIYGGVPLDFCNGVLMFLRGEEEPDSSEPNMMRQGYWRAKSDKLNLKYTSIYGNQTAQNEL